MIHFGPWLQGPAPTRLVDRSIGQRNNKFRDHIARARGVAHLSGDSSNMLFEALEEWERHLAQLDRKGPRCDDEHFRP